MRGSAFCGAGSAAQLERGERVLVRAAGALRGRQPQAVLDVVGEESPQRAVHLDGLGPVALRLVQAAFDVQPILAVEAPDAVERALRRPPWLDRRSRARSTPRPAPVWIIGLPGSSAAACSKQRLRANGVETHAAARGPPRRGAWPRGSAGTRPARPASCRPSSPGGRAGREAGGPRRPPWRRARVSSPTLDTATGSSAATAARGRRCERARDGPLVAGRKRALDHVVGRQRSRRRSTAAASGGRWWRASSRPRASPIGRHHAQLTVAGQLGRRASPPGPWRATLRRRCDRLVNPATATDGRGAVRGRGRRLQRRGCAALPSTDEQRGERDGHQQKRGHAKRGTMTAKPTRGPIAKASRPADTGCVVQPAPHVVGERGDGRVARRRLLAQRLHHDRVERSVQPAAQRVGEPSRVSLTLPASSPRWCHRRASWSRRGGSRCSVAPVPARRPRSRSLRRVRREAERPMAGQQLVEQQAEGVDVGRRRDRLARTCSGLA